MPFNAKRQLLPPPEKAARQIKSASLSAGMKIPKINRAEQCEARHLFLSFSVCFYSLMAGGFQTRTLRELVKFDKRNVF
jgi:hypothetical protein